MIPSLKAKKIKKKKKIVIKKKKSVVALIFARRNMASLEYEVC